VVTWTKVTNGGTWTDRYSKLEVTDDLNRYVGMASKKSQTGYRYS
jgi:hypothetical protein